MSVRRHFSELPDVPGFTRVADGVDERGRYTGRRLRCDLCGDVIQSLGVGYHKNGRPCVERKAERLAKEARRDERARAREQKRLDELEHEEDADETADNSERRQRPPDSDVRLRRDFVQIMWAEERHVDDIAEYLAVPSYIVRGDVGWLLRERRIEPRNWRRVPRRGVAR